MRKWDLRCYRGAWPGPTSPNPYKTISTSYSKLLKWSQKQTLVPTCQLFHLCHTRCLCHPHVCSKGWEQQSALYSMNYKCNCRALNWRKVAWTRPWTHVSQGSKFGKNTSTPNQKSHRSKAQHSQEGSCWGTAQICAPLSSMGHKPLKLQLRDTWSCTEEFSSNPMVTVYLHCSFNASKHLACPSSSAVLTNIFSTRKLQGELQGGSNTNMPVGFLVPNLMCMINHAFWALLLPCF